MEDNNLKDMEKKIIEKTYEAINYYDSCSYLKRKIEESMRKYNIIKFEEARKKTLRPRKAKNTKSFSIIKFEEGRKKVLKPKIEANNEVDKNKEVSKKQNDDDILML